MNSTKLLIGSLSNDLYRIACLTQRGSLKAAAQFLKHSQRWVRELKSKKVKNYIKTILIDLDNKKGQQQLNIKQAEKYLTYSILLQNYTLHL